MNYLLLGTPASPLYKTLMDSGLGEALIGGGLEDELRQPIFSVGLKVIGGLSFFHKRYQSAIECCWECGWGRGAHCGRAAAAHLLRGPQGGLLYFCLFPSFFY